MFPRITVPDQHDRDIIAFALGAALANIHPANVAVRNDVYNLLNELLVDNHNTTAQEK